MQLAAALTGHYPVADLLQLITTAGVDPDRAAILARAVLIATRADRDLQIVRTGDS